MGSKLVTRAATSVDEQASAVHPEGAALGRLEVAPHHGR